MNFDETVEEVLLESRHGLQLIEILESVVELPGIQQKMYDFFSKSFSVRLSIKIDQVEVIIHYLCEWMRYAVFGPTVGNDWSILRLAVLSNLRRLLLWSSWLETFQFLVTCRGCLKSDLRPLPSSDFDSENTLISVKEVDEVNTHFYTALRNVVNHV